MMKFHVAGWMVVCLTVGEVMAQDSYSPVSFPKDVGIPGFHFPEDPSVIEKWGVSNDVEAMAAHAWGLWAGLNMDSGETYEGQNLSVFETWVTEEELKGPIDDLEGGQRRSSPHQLNRLRQFVNLAVQKQSARSLTDSADILGFVKFDPTAVSHIISEDLYKLSTLKKLAKAAQDSGTIGNIPDFPDTSIVIKTAAAPLTGTSSVPGVTKDGDYWKVAVWPGPPSSPSGTTGYGPATWKTFVWVDPTNSSSPGTGPGGTSRTEANTYNVNQFINFTIDGVPTIVLAMHVTSREATRWTWQSFWWTPTPDAPQLPSSTFMAAARPTQLTGAARQYAVALSDAMTIPGQAETGGKQINGTTIKSFYGYNPHLEADFTGLGGIPPTGTTNTFGVESNCMSCHMNATYPGIGKAYVGDQYISLDAPQFKGQVRLDFLYSVGNIAEAHPNE